MRLHVIKSRAKGAYILVDESKSLINPDVLGEFETKSCLKEALSGIQYDSLSWLLQIEIAD